MSAAILKSLKWNVFGLMMLVLISCDERRRVIEPFIPSGNRVILLEEFTGKGCTNCPKGSREIENLLSQFPNNLVAVSIHAGFFANPVFFPLGQYDLRPPQASFLFDYLGPNLGYPAGVVNRTPVSGEMQTSLNQWASAITSGIQIEPAVEITIIRTYNVDTRQLAVTVNGIGKQAVSGEIRLSIMITESGIVDAQDDIEAGGIVQDYVHKHVLRDMLTPNAGAPISSGLAIGQTINQTYTYTIPSNWDAEQMEIIAFISAVNGSSFPVLQAASAHITE